MLETIAYNLERAGHRVARASSAAAGLAVLAEQTPDLIISDVMMPGMDGLVFCAAVRARGATALTPFLFVTGKGQPGDKYAGLRAGADDYVTKPFDLADLLARVNGRLEHRRKMAGLEQRLEEARHRWNESDEPREVGRARDEQARLAEEVHDAGYVDYDPPRPDDAFAPRSPSSSGGSGVAELRGGRFRRRTPPFLRVFGDPDRVGDAGSDLVWARPARARPPSPGDLTPARAPADRSARSTAQARHRRSAIAPRLSAREGSTSPVPKEGSPDPGDRRRRAVPRRDRGPAPGAGPLLLHRRRAFHPRWGAGMLPRWTKFVCATNRDLAEEVGQEVPRDLYERLAGP
jgi:CheY-like chemotaxis protein